ncbi:MAG: hypothetical protein P4L75_01200 [Clostridia bacterium]|nr:hypothetical protein [Clostridia bacterium]MDR3644287.1 hypothetical protein [Clostridia bacterium]
MEVTDIYQLPAAECGTGIKRAIRLVASPETTGEERIMIVHVVVPPLGISEGHTHPYSSEYIMFSIPGKAVLDGKEFDVPRMGVVHAKPGVLHECRNTSDTEALELYCVFTPPFEPYGIYPDLIAKSNAHLQGQA